MPIPKMTMEEVREFLDKNNFYYVASITDKNIIEYIVARVYPPSKMSVRFYNQQNEEELANEVRSIRAVHKVRGKELK